MIAALVALLVDGEDLVVEENGVGSFRMVFINMSAVAGFSYVFECTGWRG